MVDASLPLVPQKEMTDEPKPVRVHFSEGTVRELSSAMDAYERRNTEAHGEIVQQLGKYNSQSAVLKVLGILVLAVIGTAVGLIIRAEGMLDALESEIADVRLEERMNAKEGFAIARHMQKEIDILQVEVLECRKRHNELRPTRKD